MKARRGAHTVYRLAYHFVWIPRYRRQVLVGDVMRRLEELIREICVSRDWEIAALAIEEDHVHLLVSCPPRDAPARVINVIKSITKMDVTWGQSNCPWLYRQLRMQSQANSLVS